MTKAHEETNAGDRYIRYPDCGGGFMGVYICQNLPNHVL